MKQTFPWRSLAGFLVLIVFCLLAESIWGQVTPSSYPFPKPHPTTGNTPPTLIRYSQTVAPSNYGNENSILWAIDIGGGLHSRMNAADRLALNPFWTQQGAIVFDASDGIYYGVDTNLQATIPLFSNKGNASVNIYTGDGTLTSDRNLYGGGHNMSFNFMNSPTNGGYFQVTYARYIGMNALTNISYSNDELDIAAGRDVKISAPNWTNNVTDLGILASHDIRTYASNQTWFSSQIFDITGTNRLDLKSGGHLGLIGDTTDISGNSRLTLASVGNIQLLGQIITNVADTIYLVGTNGVYALAAGPLWLNGKDANVIGTNSLILKSIGDLTLQGGNITGVAATNITWTANKDVRLISQTVTNYANTIFLVGTNGLYALAAGPMWLNGNDVNVTGTNSLVVKSPANLQISGGAMTINATTNLNLVANNNVALFASNTITNHAGEIRFYSTTNTYFDTPKKVYMTADGLDFTATNYFNLDGDAQFTITAKNLAATATDSAVFGVANGNMIFLSKQLSNYVDHFITVATNGMDVFTKGLLNFDADDFQLIGTNNLSMTTFKSAYLSGLDSTLLGQNSVTVASSQGTVSLLGKQITNTAADLVLKGTNSLKAISTGLLSLQGGSVTIDGSTVAITSTNKSTLSSTTAAEVTAPTVTIKSNLNLYSADLARGLARSNNVWTLLDPSTGRGEWRAPETLTSLYREYQYKWTLGALATNAGPGNQYVAVDAASFAATRYVMVNVQDITAVSHRDDLLTGPVGQKLHIEQDFDQWGDFTTTGRPIDMLTYIIYPVSPSASQGLLPDANAVVKVAFGTATSLTTTPIANIDVVASLLWVPTGPNGLYNYANTLGYYSLNDGGGGVYYSTTFNPSFTNSGNFQSMFDKTKMWSLLQPRDGVYVKQYGAKGDGSNDDTLAVKDWLHDINSKIGLVNVGTYSISPISTEPGAVLTIRGNSRFGLTSPNLSLGLFVGNCATFQRRAGTGGTNALFNVVSNATMNLYQVVLDGNKAGDPTSTNAYLYLINGGKGSELESCYFGNSAGHGICIVGSGGNWSVIRNCRLYDVNRAIRLNQTSGVTINNVHMQMCRDNALALVNFSTLTRCNQLFIADVAGNGIFLEGATHNRFSDCEIQKCFQAGIMFSGNGGQNIQDNSFIECSIISANAASSALVGTSPYAAGTYSPVMVTSDTAIYCLRNRFDGCLFGDLTGGVPNRGKYVFEWTAPNSATHYPWEMWMMVNNQYVWGPQWLADFSPGVTNNFSEINGLHTSSSFQSTFGTAGAITGAGLRVDIVEAGTTGGANAVTYLNNSNHKLLRDTAGYGTVVVPTAMTRAEHESFLLPPTPEPKAGPIPDP